jgi:Anti-sigma factor N-terminus
VKKGIVMELHRKYIIVMTSDGSFAKAHTIDNVVIGSEVNFEPVAKKPFINTIRENLFTLRVVAMACIFLIALIPLYMMVDGDTAYAYVDIDINPSIELEIDDDLEVSEITPLNDDAVSLLEEIGDLRGKKLAQVIEVIMTTSENRGLVNASKNVLVGVHYTDEENEQDKQVLEIIDRHFSEEESDWEVVTVEIPEEIRETAEENKQSMNEALANSFEDEKVDEVAEIEALDKEVLESFYRNNKKEIVTDFPVKQKELTERSKITEEMPTQRSERSTDELHPSDLKSENVDNNSEHKSNDRGNGLTQEEPKGNRDTDTNKNNDNAKSNQGKGNDNGRDNKGNDEDDKEKKDNRDKRNNNNHGNNGKNHNHNNGKPEFK